MGIEGFGGVGAGEVLDASDLVFVVRAFIYCDFISMKRS